MKYKVESYSNPSQLLVTGVLCNGRVRCPLHGACFNVETGDIEDFPGLDPVPTFEVLNTTTFTWIVSLPTLYLNIYILLMLCLGVHNIRESKIY